LQNEPIDVRVLMTASIGPDNQKAAPKRGQAQRELEDAAHMFFDPFFNTVNAARNDEVRQVPVGSSS
jgi:hypothetical protein